MGDPEAKGMMINPVISTISGPLSPQLPPATNNKISPLNTTKFGCSPTYICSVPGFLRLLNIAFGFIAFGLWLPGYPHEFLGERINQQTGDTEKGYGNGWTREPLNQFVLAAILICLGASCVMLIGLVIVKQASVDWNRFNKLLHFGLAVFCFIAAICSIFGVWYFNENCCHVSMDWEGVGLSFSLSAGETNYVRHCYCYLTKYLNVGDQFQSSVRETILYEATKHPDVSGFDHHWTFMAHDLDPHFAAIFILFLNSIFYFLGFLFSKSNKV
ncbi:uncharacterized protein LOC118437684 [Folsomia candida]|uniref:Uncharacterized protein n=1 Tax=Folsomia candida TaxID=158441 RepID=A0A226DMX3_FOLCA|nr:uncharacterized protein LOC118437684 [Folsomia candida]OXA46460.1 hypothetical protein Fcan01_18754 [Folsomia candida]